MREALDCLMPRGENLVTEDAKNSLTDSWKEDFRHPPPLGTIAGVEEIPRETPGSAAASPLNTEDLRRQMALAEVSNRISSCALLNASCSQSMNNLPPSESAGNESLADFPATGQNVRGDSFRRQRALGAGLSKLRGGALVAASRAGGADTPVTPGFLSFEETGDEAAASLEEMLREASMVHGMRLKWLLCVMFSVVVLVFTVLLTEVHIVVEENNVISEKESVSISALTTVSKVEWLYYNVKSVVRIYESIRGLIPNLPAADETRTQLCRSLGGAPLVFATYNSENAALTGFYSCPLATAKGVKPPVSLKTMDIPISGSLRMAVYRSEFVIAAISSTDNTEFFAVVLRKESIGRLLFAHFNSLYATAILKHSSTAVLLPDFFTSKLTVVVHNLNYQYVNHSVSHQTELNIGLQSAFDNICAAGKEYTWHTVMRPIYNESYIWEHDAKGTYNNMPTFYIRKKNLWGGVLRITMCGVVCSDSVGYQCAPDNPTNTWFVVNDEPLQREAGAALFAVKNITAAAIVLFFFMALIVYVSVRIPVQHLKQLIFNTVGNKGTKNYSSGFFSLYSRFCWLGELQALIKTFQLLCFCFRLNKKYVPQHVLEQQVLALRNSKDYVWRTIVETTDIGDTEREEEGDDDAVGNEQESIEAFLNTVSALDNKVPAVSGSRSSGAFIRRESNAPGFTVPEGELSESNLPFGTEQNNTILGRHSMTLIEGATILVVYLCAVETAYFTNYHVALRQHRRIMNYILQRIRHYRGELFVRSGDCVAAAWNAFESRVDHASAAASCALSIAKFLAHYRQAGFRVGIVLHQGPFVCGVVADNKEAFTTAFGTVPRQAIALAELAASLPCFHVLVSEPVKQSLASRYECIIVDVIRYHENDNPIVMFELNGERRLPPNKGIPLTPSTFAEKHAQVFYDFRYHHFDQALAGVEQLRSLFPDSGSQLLKRLELLSNFYMQRKNELPMPYFRPYPTWLNYEAIASADYITDMSVYGSKEVLPDTQGSTRTKSIFEDDTAKFLKELRDNVLASRRIQNSTRITEALDTDCSKPEWGSAKISPRSKPTASVVRPAKLTSHSLHAMAKSVTMDLPSVARNTTPRLLNRAQSERWIEPGEKGTDSDANVNDGNYCAAGKKLCDGSGGILARGATLVTSNPTAVVNTERKNFSADCGGRERSPFAQSLRSAPFDCRPHNHFCGTDSLISLNSEAMLNAASTSLGDFDKSFVKASNEIPQTIVAKNGIEYIRSSRILGKGSFGCVYLGMEILSGRFVAIKFLPLPLDEEEIAKVQSEVVTMQKVKSNHIVEFISYAFTSNRIVIVMECMMAGSLQGLISGFGKFRSATARLFIRDVLRGLHRLHLQGIIHRDVKPQNVLHSLAGSCKISDFGASAFLHELVRRQAEGKGLQVQGTPVYLAPEAARGKPEEKSDIWSCGVMFIQLVTGRLPYAEEFLLMPPQILVYQIGSGAAKPIIPESLDEFDGEFVRSCLKDDPGQRLSAKQLLELPLFVL